MTTVDEVRELRARHRRRDLAARMAHYLKRYPAMSDWELARLLYATTDEIRAVRDAK